MEGIARLRILLERFKGNAELAAGLREALRPLVQYDRERGADLVKTLVCYIQQQGNTLATAERLFLHRNSVLYRLSRIQEIASFDPRSPEAWETLQAAILLAGEEVLGQPDTLLKERLCAPAPETDCPASSPRSVLKGSWPRSASR